MYKAWPATYRSEDGPGVGTGEFLPHLKGPARQPGIARAADFSREAGNLDYFGRSL